MDYPGMAYCMARKLLVTIRPARSGKALGIVSQPCIGTCSEEGPTVQGIVSDAARSGFPVTLRTV